MILKNVLLAKTNFRSSMMRMASLAFSRRVEYFSSD
jgi:hypothetical protein